MDKIIFSFDKRVEDSKKPFFILGLLLVLSFIIMLATLILAPLDRRILLSYFSDILLLTMNFIPVFLFISLLYILSNRLWLAYLIAFIVFISAAIVNRLKFLYRDEPLTFVDIRLLKESLIMAKEYDLRLDFKTIMFLIIWFSIAILIKLFFDYRIDSRKTRAILMLIIIIISMTVFNKFYFNPQTYEKVGNKELINIWLQSDQYRSKGFLYPFIYSIKDSNEVEFKDYDEEKAKKAMEIYAYDDIADDKKVNIIAIMLEAYNDFSKFHTLSFNTDVYKHFHRIQSESLSGNLLTNIFAGGTVDTERAFLTGFKNHPRYFKKTNSFVWYLLEQGYKTEAMHPITGSFYNRRNINQYLGFESFDHFDNKYRDIQPSYLRDIDFFPYIIEGFKNSKQKSQPYFNFSVTYQNHGPYSVEKLVERDYLKRKPYYDEDMYNIINNYLAGIYETDIALKGLIDYFEGEEEAVILVLFGDHNPWLGENRLVYDILDIDMDLSTLKGFKNYYEIPYIIWGNGAAKRMFGKSFYGKGNDISPHFLMVELFEYMGWESNEYFKYLKNIKKEFDVTHKLFFKEDDAYKKELSEKNKALWDEFLNVEHYYSHNFIEKFID